MGDIDIEIKCMLISSKISGNIGRNIVNIDIGIDIVLWQCNFFKISAKYRDISGNNDISAWKSEILIFSYFLNSFHFFSFSYLQLEAKKKKIQLEV